MQQQSQQQPQQQRLSLQEIWRLGCADQSLHPLDAAHYTHLARSRFHTYMLGMQHAAEQPENAELLVKGMASELSANPGLERQWRQYNFSDSTSGKLVTSLLSPEKAKRTDSWLSVLTTVFSRNRTH